jgi:hypothetical protein
VKAETEAGLAAAESHPDEATTAAATATPAAHPAAAIAIPLMQAAVATQPTPTAAANAAAPPGACPLPLPLFLACGFNWKDQRPANQTPPPTPPERPDVIRLHVRMCSTPHRRCRISEDSAVPHCGPVHA